MNITVSKTISFTFGEGQAEGIDNVSVTLSVPSENLLTGEVSATSVQLTLALPSAGWNEEDVLLALQEKYPNATIAWE